MNSLESFARFIPITATSPQGVIRSNILTDVELKARKFTNSLNDCMYEVANEPSLGFYRIQEHVRKSVPAMIEKNADLEGFQSRLKGSSFDLDYSLDAIVKMSRADTNFESIQSLLTDSLFVARKLSIRNSSNASSGLVSLSDSPKSSKSITKEKAKSTKESLLNFISTKKLSTSPQKVEPTEKMNTEEDLDVKGRMPVNENEANDVVGSEKTENKLKNIETDLDVNDKIPVNEDEAKVVGESEADSKKEFYEVIPVEKQKDEINEH